MTERLGTDEASLARAIELLRDGEVVALPTETVYGLAARADDATAVQRIFTAKGRPTDNPLIVHVADAEDVASVASDVTVLARTLLARFAPGPLTVVLTASPTLPRAVTGGLDTVAVRVPDHTVMRAVLARVDLPLAAPSANRSSRPSPTTAAHVLADLEGRIAAVVDAGRSRVGLESTVVDARGSVPVILRDGAVTREAIAAAIGLDVTVLAAGEGAAVAVSPGTRHPHYAPGLPVHVTTPGSAGALRTAAALVTAGAGARSGDGAAAGGARIGLVLMGSPPDMASIPPGVVLIANPADAAALGTRLFALLREAGELDLDALVVEGVSPVGFGRAVMDRLQRAALASGGHAGR
jgi:L-threonylcarbamoyladenylate synthase